jgi:hypothetical protein
LLLVTIMWKHSSSTLSVRPRCWGTTALASREASTRNGSRLATLRKRFLHVHPAFAREPAAVDGAEHPHQDRHLDGAGA